MMLSERILAAARGAWPSVLGRLGVRVELLTPRHGPCPGCGGRDRFRFDDKDGDGTFICGGGGGNMVAGNGIDLAAHALGIPWKEALKRLAVELGLEQGKSDAPRPKAKVESVKPKAVAAAKRQEFDARALAAVVPTGIEAPARVLAAHSPVWPEIGSAEFIGHLYRPGENVLVFTSQLSQGDYGAHVGADGSVRCFALGSRPGVWAKPVDGLPKGGKNGVWFLNQPVTGKWTQNARSTTPDGDVRLTRRSAVNVTSWRYLVLESDEAEPDEWLKLLVSIPLPISAIYTSGGRSIHALVRVDAASKPQWDALRDRISPLVTKLGADPAAMTAVRLTRLPGALRFGKTARDGTFEAFERPQQQKLLYLNPRPECRPICGLPRKWETAPI